MQIKRGKLSELKLQRLRRGWPLWYVAGRLGISESQISRFENHPETAPDSWLNRFAKLYGVPVEELKENPVTAEAER